MPLGPDGAIVICYRVEDFPESLAPAREVPCTVCEKPIWRSYTTPDEVEGVEVKAVCSHCALDLNTFEPGEGVVAIHPDQRQWLREQGLTDDEINSVAQALPALYAVGYDGTNLDEALAKLGISGDDLDETP